MKEINCVTEDRYIAKVRSTRICSLPIITVKKKQELSPVLKAYTVGFWTFVFACVCDSEREEGGHQ